MNHNFSFAFIKHTTRGEEKEDTTTPINRKEMRRVKKKKDNGWGVDENRSSEILSNVALGFSIFVFILSVVVSFFK